MPSDSLDDDFGLDGPPPAAQPRPAQERPATAPTVPEAAAPSQAASLGVPGLWFYCQTPEDSIRWRPVAALQAMRALSAGTDGTYRRFLDLQACSPGGVVKIDAHTLAVLKVDRRTWRRHRDELLAAGKLKRLEDPAKTERRHEVDNATYTQETMQRTMWRAQDALQSSIGAGKASALKRFKGKEIGATRASTNASTGEPTNAATDGSTTSTSTSITSNPLSPLLKMTQAERDLAFEGALRFLIPNLDGSFTPARKDQIRNVDQAGRYLPGTTASQFVLPHVEERLRELGFALVGGLAVRSNGYAEPLSAG